jgi:hypothetical protein
MMSFVDLKKTFMGVEAPPKVDRGLVKLTVHQKKVTVRQYGNGISHDSPIRYFAIKLTYWKWFEYFILVCIAINSIGLAFYDYSYKNQASNDRIDFISDVVTIIFMAEACVKILALGFGFQTYSYIRDPWNILDFVISLTGLLDFMGKSFANLKPIRSLRVLRPLRSVSTIKGIRVQVETLLLSLPKLGQVSIFLLFMFILFGIFGLQLFVGAIYGKCRTTPQPLNATYWPHDDTHGVCDY